MNKAKKSNNNSSKDEIDNLWGSFRTVRGINSTHRRDREIYHKLVQIEHGRRESFVGNILSTFIVVLTLILLILSVHKVNWEIILLLALAGVFTVSIVAYELSRKFHLKTIHREIEKKDKLELTRDKKNQFISEKAMAEDILSRYQKKKNQIGSLSESEEKKMKNLVCNVIPWYEEQIKECEVIITQLKEEISKEELK